MLKTNHNAIADQMFNSGRPNNPGIIKFQVIIRMNGTNRKSAMMETPSAINNPSPNPNPSMVSSTLIFSPSNLV